MSVKDRWLGYAGFVCSILPFLFVVVSLQFLPYQVPIVWKFSSEIIRESTKYGNLFIGIFCMVSLFFVVVGYVMKWKNKIERNFYSIIITSIILSCIFFAVVIYFVFMQAVSAEKLYSPDLCSVISVSIAVVASVLSNVFGQVTLNDKFYLKVKKPEIYLNNLRKTLSFSGYFLSITYMLLSVGCAFVTGFASIIILIGGLIGGLAVCFIYFVIVKRKPVKE